MGIKGISYKTKFTSETELASEVIKDQQGYKANISPAVLQQGYKGPLGL